MPEFELGWLNGWLLLGSFYLVFALLMIIFPRPVVARLYDISGWSRKQRILSAAGKPFALATLALAIFTPLKLGEPVFSIGLAIFLAGYGLMLIALFNFARTRVDRPVNKGVYRLSRNPQWVGLAMMFLGTALAIGSWMAVILVALSAVFYHFRILGEERSCSAKYGEAYESYLGQVPRYFAFF